MLLNRSGPVCLFIKFRLQVLIVDEVMPIKREIRSTQTVIFYFILGLQASDLTNSISSR